MKGVTAYCNTDLCLTAPTDPAGLVAELESAGVAPLGPAVDGLNGLWYVTLETEIQYEAPALTIAAMLGGIESLSAPARDVWRSCVQRELNIGFDCGEEPWAFNEGLSVELVRRIANVEASIRVTLYPIRDAPTAPYDGA